MNLSNSQQIHLFGLALCQAGVEDTEETDDSHLNSSRDSGAAKDSVCTPTRLKFEDNCQSRLVNCTGTLPSHFTLSLQLPHHICSLFPPCILGKTRELWWKESRYPEGRGVVKSKVSTSSCSEFEFRLPLAGVLPNTGDLSPMPPLEQRWRWGACFRWNEISAW